MPKVWHSRQKQVRNLIFPTIAVAQTSTGWKPNEVCFVKEKNRHYFFVQNGWFLTVDWDTIINTWDWWDTRLVEVSYGFWRTEQLPVNYTSDGEGVLWYLSFLPEFPAEVVASIHWKDEFSYNWVAVCDWARIVFDPIAANYNLSEWGLAIAKYRTRWDELLRFVAKPYTDGSQNWDGSRWLNKLYWDPALTPLPNNYYKPAPLAWYTSILLNRPRNFWKLVWVYHNYYKFWASMNYATGSFTNPRWVAVMDDFIYIWRNVIEKRSVSNPSVTIATINTSSSYVYAKKHLEKKFLYCATWDSNIRRVDLATFSGATSLNVLAWGSSGQTQRIVFDGDYWYVCVNGISVGWWITKFNATDDNFSVVWRTAQAIWPTVTDNLVRDCVIIWNNIYAVWTQSTSPNLYIFNKNTLTLDNVITTLPVWIKVSIRYSDWYLFILYESWTLIKVDINTFAVVATISWLSSNGTLLEIEWDYVYASSYPSIKKIDKNAMVNMNRSMNTWHLSDQFVMYEDKIYAVSQPFNMLYIADYKLPDFTVNGVSYTPWMTINTNTVTIQVPTQVQLKKFEYVLTLKK